MVDKYKKIYDSFEKNPVEIIGEYRKIIGKKEKGLLETWLDIEESLK